MARRLLPRPVRNDRVERGGVLRPSVGHNARYVAELDKLLAEMFGKVEREVTALFKSPTAIASHVTTDASISSQSRILMNALISEFSVLFAQAARGVSERMVSGVMKDSESGVMRSLKEVGHGITLGTDVLKRGPVAEIAKASVAENVALIKSIPASYLGKVQSAVMRSITTGNGLQDLVPFMTKQKGITERHARNMAFDQTRKLYNGLNKGRMQAAGIGEFEWIHTGGGQKPRPDHVEMSGNIYSFSELPIIDQKTGERGIPGQAPNCRCTMRPILKLGEG